MAPSSRSPTSAPDAARAARARAERESGHAPAAKARAEYSRCSKWAPECINRSRRIAMPAEAKEKSSQKAANARPASAKKQ